jgi:hypothetical protein
MVLVVLVVVVVPCAIDGWLRRHQGRSAIPLIDESSFVMAAAAAKFFPLSPIRSRTVVPRSSFGAVGGLA